MMRILRVQIGRGLIGHQEVRPASGITGAEPAPVELGLSATDVQSAFVTCQRGDGGEEGLEVFV